MSTYGDRLDIVGVAGRDDTDAMQRFVDDYGLGAMTNLDAEDLWRAFGVRGQPAWVVIPATGEPEITYGRIGLDAIGQLVDRLAA